jgi:hypothetical protein
MASCDLLRRSQGRRAADQRATGLQRHRRSIGPLRSAFDSLTLKLLYDDGAAVYLNGTEIARRNLSAGAGFDALATGTQQALENTWLTFTVNPSLLVQGTKTLAVEVHQVSRTDSDVSFDLQLSGTAHLRSFTLQVTRNNDSRGTVQVEPNLPLYLAGTVVTLTATPIEGKPFKEWTIWTDANRHPDPNFAAIDSNLILQLTMAHDCTVEAAFKCGSGVGVVLPLLGFGVAVVGFAARMIRGRN